MADPVTIAAVGMGASVLGGAVNTAGALWGGQAKSNMYKYQAGVARINANIARKNAEYSRYMGEHEAQRVGMKGRFEQGQTKVAQSSRGLDVNSGSAEALRDSQGELSRHDQTVTRATAARRAYGFDVEATNKEAEARMAETSADNAKTASYFEAAGSILGTASSVSSKWLDASRLGIF